MITSDDMIFFYKLRDEDDIGSFYLCDTQAIEVLAEYRESIRAEARAEALRDAADRAWNFLKVNPYCYRWNEKELRAAITQEPQP